MKLKKLHSDVIKKTRSSFMINTLSQAALELILNSLDAEATAIAVRINMVTLRIQVVDNGKGVLKENMQSIGNRYFTNKCSSLEDLEKRIKHYGFRGEALANLIELSKSINICSRHTSTPETFSLTYEKNNKREPIAEKTRPSVGTTVTVEGLFEAFPVRKKRIVKEIEMDDVQRNLRSLIIIHPHVTFSLRDDVRNELILSSRRTQDIPSAFRLLHPDMKDGAVMKISKGKLSINSLLFKDYTENKHQQYIYVNKRPVFSSKMQKLMKKLLNKNTKYQETKLVNSNKYPSYVINIKCPYSDVDILSSPHTVLAQFKNWNRIETCIEKLINCFFGNPQNKKENPIEQKELSDNVPLKCGISQIKGAVQAFGYRRKNEPEHTSPPKQESKKKPSILKNSYNENRLNNDSHDIINPTCFYQQTKALKHPLPITVAPQNEPINETNVKEKSIICRKRSHPLEVETFSKYTDDEHRGKNLILDMFLKSTLVYKSEENVLNTSQQSGDTIYVEESDFMMENNVQTTHKGKTKTMSVSINVKSRKKIKKRKNCTPEKRLQTVSADKMVSKCVQTTLQNDKSATHCSDKENFSVNCTLVFTSRKGNNLKFVHKRPQNSENFELFNKESSQKCSCNCHEKKLFNFGHKDFKNQNNVVETAIEANVKDTFEFKSFGDILEQTTNQTEIRLEQNINTSRYFDPDLQWRIDKKRKLPNILKCEQSPYFKDKRHHPAKNPPNDYFNLHYNNENYNHYPITANTNNFLNQYNQLVKNIQNHNVPNLMHQFPQTYEGNRMEFLPYNHPYNPNIVFKYPPINPVIEDHFLPYNRFQHTELFEQGPTYNKAPVHFIPQNFKESHKNQADFPISNKAFEAPNTPYCKKVLDNHNLHSNNLDIPLRNEESVIYEYSNDTMPIPSFKQFQPAFKSTQKNPYANSIINLSLANQINSKTSFENFQAAFKSTWKNPSFLDFSLKNQQNNESSNIQSFGQFKPIFKSTQEKNSTKHYTNEKQIPGEIERENPISGIFPFKNERERNSEDQQNQLRKASDLEISLNETDKEILMEAEIAAKKQLLMKEFAEWNSQFTFDEQKSNDDWDWTKRDHLGNCYYIHKKTGFTTYNVPNKEENNCFEMKERYEFLPKGMSPIIKEPKAVEESLSQNGKDVLLDYILETYKDDLLFVKWQHYIKDLDIKTFFANMYTEKLKMYECCIPILKADNKQEVVNLNKNIFESLDFVGQLDKKFIVVKDVKENMLIIFDQHAVHERIRVEKLIKIYKNAKAVIQEKLMFFIPDNELSLLKRFPTYLDHIGMNMEFFTNGIYVTEVPLCLYTKFKEDPINSLNKIIHTLINEVLDLLKSTRGVSLKTMPTLIQNVINLEACRGAIKFGDLLTHEKCLELLRELSKCDLPFQCAHGRPTVTPLLRLTTQKPVEKPINLKNLKRLKNMHS
ncbi:unnamed protein product [Phyllotreta striolata]|uniref:Uncharacterized protein n=1 Tax=Phyllotreta striolata TaxID=444603 RepID=A0A9N9TQT9_PHYSR|nr:unnamed protein product [Phyllotreta striolata]